MPTKVFDTKTLIVASSIIAIPIIGLVIVAIYRRRTIQTPSIVISRQEPKQGKTEQIATAHLQARQTIEQQPQTPLQHVQESQTRTVVAGAASSEEILKEKAAKITTISGAVSIKEQPEDISSGETSVYIKAIQAGESLKELIATAIKEVKHSAEQTGKQLKEQKIIDIAATADSKDIRSLGSSNVQAMSALFEDILAEIHKEGYDEQVILLDGYKRLLQEQIRVANTRRKLASRLKPGA